MQEKLEEVESMTRLVFIDEATLHTNGRVNRHNVRICGEGNPHPTVVHVRDSIKVSVLCAISKKQVCRMFFFGGNVTGDVYLHMPQNWLMDKLTANEHEYFVFQLDGTPPHCQLSVRAFCQVFYYMHCLTNELSIRTTSVAQRIMPS